MTQVARPIEDTFFSSVEDSWHTELDDLSFLYLALRKIAKNDNSFAESPLSEASEPYVVKLGSVEEPNVETTQGLNVLVRMAKDFSGGKQVDALVELREGYVSETDAGVLIGNVELVNISEVFTDYTFPVTAENRALITNPNNLFLRTIFSTP